MSNSLINEQSPYLLDHAENPVDWYPWCDEAFEKARREDKPVFLSIGSWRRRADGQVPDARGCARLF